MRIEKDETAALIIDVQEKLYPHMFDRDALLQRMVKLVKGLKILGVPLFLTQQYTRGLGETIQPIKILAENSSRFEKLSFSCCDEVNILMTLRNLNKKFILIIGIEAHVCVLQTVIDLLSNGFLPVVVADCISSRKEFDKLIALERIKNEGAIITTYESLLLELCRIAGNEKFKALSGLIK